MARPSREFKLLGPTFKEPDRLSLQDFELGVDPVLELEDQRQRREDDRQIAEERVKEERMVRQRAVWAAVCSTIAAEPRYYETTVNGVVIRGVIQTRDLVDHRLQETSIAVSLCWSGLRPR